MLNLLRQRNFALLWTGGLISGLGDMFLFLALPFYTYHLTGSTLATGAMFIVETVPRALLSSVAGVFADRWDRKRTLIGADLLRAVGLLPLLVVHSPATVWVIYVVAFTQSAIGQFFAPAKGALIPRVAGERYVVPANALGALSDRLTGLLGPALGAALQGLVGFRGVVMLDSASFLISGLLIALMRVPAPDLPSDASAPVTKELASAGVWRDLLAGLRLVRRERWLTVLFIVVGISQIGQGIIGALLVPFVNDVVRGGAAEFGWIVTAEAVGGVMGGLLIGKVSRLLSPTGLIALSMWVLGSFFLALVHTAIFPLVLIPAALNGIAGTAFAITVVALIQRGVGDTYRGRVLGAFHTVLALMQLMGMGLGSALGDRLGVVVLFDVVVGLWLLGGAIALTLPSADSSPSNDVISPVGEAAAPEPHESSRRDTSAASIRQERSDECNTLLRTWSAVNKLAIASWQ
jgi:MFS family permease